MRKKRNRLVIVAFISLLLVVGVVFSIQLVQERQDIAPRASQVETVTSITEKGKRIDFSISGLVKDFPIANPQVGGLKFECDGVGNSNKEWHIRQWNNDKSLCLDTNSQDANRNCPGATSSRSTNTSRYCYWQSQRKIDLSVNTSNMNNQGCFIHDSPLRLANTGGYSAYLYWDATQRPDFWSSDTFTVGNLDSLRVTTRFENVYFASKQCTNGKIDPVIKTNSPIGFTYISVVAKQVDASKKTFGDTIFYQAVTYDNRPDKIAKDYTYLNCKKSLTTATGMTIVASEPVSALDLPIAYPTNLSKDGGEKQYSINVLPRMLHYLSKCGAQVDLSNYKVTSMYIGSESYNGVVATSYVIEPRLTFVKK